MENIQTQNYVTYAIIAVVAVGLFGLMLAISLI